MNKIKDSFKKYNLMRYGGFIYGIKINGKDSKESLKVRLVNQNGELILWLGDETFNLEEVK